MVGKCYISDVSEWVFSPVQYDLKVHALSTSPSFQNNHNLSNTKRWNSKNKLSILTGVCLLRNVLNRRTHKRKIEFQ